MVAAVAPVVLGTLTVAETLRLPPHAQAAGRQVLLGLWLGGAALADLVLLRFRSSDGSLSGREPVMQERNRRRTRAAAALFIPLAPAVLGQFLHGHCQE